MTLVKLLADWPAIRAYVLAGNATFTLRSGRTGTRYTYRVRRVKDRERWFVAALTGPENDAAYTYLGMLEPDGTFHDTAGSRLRAGAPCWRAFLWFANAMRQPSSLAHFQFWHSGHCGRCGRLLTVPESVETGLGPECAARAVA